MHVTSVREGYGHSKSRRSMLSESSILHKQCTLLQSSREEYKGVSLLMPSTVLRRECFRFELEEAPYPTANVWIYLHHRYEYDFIRWSTQRSE